MFNVRLAGGHLYGKQLFTWLSLVVSFMASFVLSFFPLDVLDGIWDLIESVSEGFLTYSFSNINLFISSDRERSPYKNIFKDGCLYGEIAFFIHYVELDKMNNERKNVERSLCYHNDVRENLICFNKEIEI